MNIKKISLTNFKAYKSETFELGQLSIFCGSNSVGKSTAIQALCLFFQSDFKNSKSLRINGDLVSIGNIDDIHNHANRLDDNLIVSIQFKDRSFEWGYKNADSRESLKQNEIPLINTPTASDVNFLINWNFNVQYLWADRFGPKDNFPLSQHNYHPYWLGTKGEYTIEVLEHITQGGAEERFDSQIKDLRKHPTIQSAIKFASIQAWMEEIAPGHKLIMSKIENANIAYNMIRPSNGEETKPINIGYGFSYTLSTVTALILASPGDVVIIESPEAHLHPKGQSYLGRLIYLSAKAGVQVLIETHSDHLLNGVRVAARLSSKEEDDSLAKVFFISSNQSETKVDELSINPNGSLSAWPQGFFDQQALDIKLIIKGQ